VIVILSFTLSTIENSLLITILLPYSVSTVVDEDSWELTAS